MDPLTVRLGIHFYPLPHESSPASMYVDVTPDTATRIIEDFAAASGQEGNRVRVYPVLKAPGLPNGAIALRFCDVRCIC